VTDRYYVLEDGVALPRVTQVGRGQAQTIYPFDTILPGQSFLVPHEQGKSVAVVAAQITEKKGWRFATRLMNEGVRVWRLHPKVTDGERS